MEPLLRPLRQKTARHLPFTECVWGPLDPEIPQSRATAQNKQAIPIVE